MLRLFPELFSKQRVSPVEAYPDALLATLRSLAPMRAARDPKRGAAHSRPLQLGVLRALVPGRQARRRPRRGLRPLHQGRRGLHADHRRAAARRRHLPAHRRRLPRSPGVPARFGPRRARPDERLPERQRHARQRGRHRHRRRQGGLQLHAGDRPLLHRRGADPAQRADLALPREGRAQLRPVESRRPRRQGGQRLGRLRHAGGAPRHQARDRGVRPQAAPRAGRLHRPADPGALDLSDLRRLRRRAPPRRSQALRALGRRRDPDRARRADPGRLKEGSLVVNSSQGGGTKDTWVLDG